MKHKCKVISEKWHYSLPPHILSFQTLQNKVRQSMSYDYRLPALLAVIPFPTNNYTFRQNNLGDEILKKNQSY